MVPSYNGLSEVDDGDDDNDNDDVDADDTVSILPRRADGRKTDEVSCAEEEDNLCSVDTKKDSVDVINPISRK